MIETSIIEYKWIYGFCSEAIAPIIYSVAVIITLKIGIQFFLVMRRKKVDKSL